MAIDLTRIVKVGIDARESERGGRKVKKAFDRSGKAAKQARNELGQFEVQSKKTTKASDTLKRSLFALTGGFTAMLVIRQTLKDIADFEQGLVGVGKTADLEGAALDRMGDQMIDLSLKIPAATDELLAIGQAAGQLGVKGEENILKFTETVAKLASASDLVGDEGATSLARILNVTGEGVEKVDTLSSVIVGLGNNVAATEKEIARATTGVAQATAIYDIGSTAAAAYGATMAELGVRAELGGSSMGRAFRTIDAAVRGGGESLRVLELLTGKSGDQLAIDFKEDPTTVVNDFLKGLGSVVEQGGDAVKTLEALGLSGEEVLKVIPTLAVNQERLARNMKLANDEAKVGTALNEEAARAADTFGSELKIMKNTTRALRLELIESKGPLKDFVRSTSDGIRVLGGFDDKGREVTEGGERMAVIMQGLALVVTVATIPAVVTMAAKLPALATQLTLTGTAAAGMSVGFLAALGAITALVAFDFGGWLYENTEGVRKFGDDLVSAIQTKGADFKKEFSLIINDLKEIWDDLTDFFIVGMALAAEVVVQMLKDAIGVVPQSARNAISALPGPAGTIINAASSVENIPANHFMNTAVTDTDTHDYQGETARIVGEYEARLDEIGHLMNAAAEERNQQFDENGRLDGTTYLDSFGEALGENLFDPMRQGFSELFGASAQVVNEMTNELTPAVDEAGNASNQAAVDIDKLNSALGDTASKADSATNSVMEYFEALKLEQSLVFLSGDQRERAISLRGLENDLMGMSVDELRAVQAQLEGGDPISSIAEDPEKIALVNDLLGKADVELQKLQKAQEIKQMFDDMGQAGADAFTSWITGAESAQDALKGLLEQLIQIGAQQFIGGFLSDFLGGSGGNGGLITDLFSGLFSGSSKGNIFNDGRITPHARGGIVDQMGIFPMTDGGIGSIAERGEEAVAYPKRMQNGDMGFEVQTSGSAKSQVNNFNLIMEKPEEFGMTQQQTLQAFRPVTNRIKG